MNRRWKFDSSFDPPRFSRALRQEPPDLTYVRDALPAYEEIMHEQLTLVGCRIYFAGPNIASAFHAILAVLAADGEPVTRHEYAGPAEEQFGPLVRWYLEFRTLKDAGDAWDVAYPRIYDELASMAVAGG